MAMFEVLFKRQIASGNDGNNDGYGVNSGYYSSWWFSPIGMAVRYILVALLFGLVILYFVGGHYHAQRRVRKGLAPLSYHRWMVKKSYAATNYPPIPNRYAYHQDPNVQGYPLENFQPPPPAYNSADAPPPVYQPPPGGSKAMADQSFNETSRIGESSASSGPAVPARAAPNL